MHVCLRYWVLQDGRAVNWSVKELASKKPDEIVAPNAREAYHLVGEELQYQPLGMLPDEERGSQRHIRQVLERALLFVYCSISMFLRLMAFRAQPGTLEERLWRRLKWQLPEDETQMCWWRFCPHVPAHYPTGCLGGSPLYLT